MQFSPRVRNAALDAMEALTGASPTLELRTGSMPANTGVADSGTVLATMVLPSDWMANASAGAKGLSGVWQDLSADATGIAGYYRIKGGGVVDYQGTVTGTGGGGDMTLDNINLAITQAVSITSFTLNIGGA
ncbi:MAG: uncharacterized protein JWS10_944 [Cypionkella sp.]|uniref:hypothetical protein n=1 Tax=Cypionkella sp. TaxID=2811411 RepID=UPI002608E595|nr:hypothetical protein [Cypionkella sp.]MDB5658329.1 uncharacterized protein [Cypionkella sp.]